MISTHAMRGYFCPAFYVIYNWMLSKNRIICLTFYYGMQHITASCCTGCMFLLASFNYGALDAKIVCRLEVSSRLVESICIPHLLIRLKWFWKRLLVSTYVVCERLSVMHEPAGVVEILVQNPQNTPFSEVQFQNTPSPENENCQRVQIWEFQNTPPNENCQRVQIWEFQNTPPKWKLSESPNPRVSE